MAEITFISNKARKEALKYLFIALTALGFWIIQVSILSHFLYLDTSPNLLLLGCVYWGLALGPLSGTLFGMITSFLCTSLFYDHVFYFSFPLIGLLAGLFTKNIFSDELLFFILLSFLFTLPFEILSGWQYSLKNPTDILNRYLLIGPTGAIVNMVLSPLFYLTINFVAKKLKLR